MSLPTAHSRRWTISVTYARENPGKLTVGTTGSLSSNHLSFALFSKLTGLQMTRVPFNSAGKMNAALLGGQIDATFNNLQWLTMYPGKLRVLSTASTERLQPDIPTFIQEQGYPGNGGYFGSQYSLRPQGDA